MAFVLTGLTVANVVGVPLITRLGQVAGWRMAYLAVGAVFLLALVAVPSQPAEPGGFAGFFAVYSYVAEVVGR